MRIISNQSRKSSQAFTLIEMIGVLAVIAILASMLIPKIFEAINSARINNAAVGFNTMKTAAMEHYGKYGSFFSSNGVPVAAGDAALLSYDRQILFKEALVDKPFITKIATAGVTNTFIRVLPAVAATTAPDGIVAAYNLDGALPVNDTSGPTAGDKNIVEAVIMDVATEDAIELNNRLDGRDLGNPAGGADILGRVIYDVPSGGVVNVHIYIAHR
jgi:prepilin-type N-terminal cleavage/methylation domain-containing protein